MRLETESLVDRYPVALKLGLLAIELFYRAVRQGKQFGNDEG